MEVTEALRQRLVDTAAIAAAVGARIYPDVLPQSWKPSVGTAVVYQLVSAVVAEDLEGPVDAENWRIQFDVWSNDRKTSQAVARLLQDELAEIAQEAVGAVWIDGVSVAGGQRWTSSAPPDGSDDWWYCTSFDVRVAHQVR